MPKHQIKVKLTGKDGNAFALIGGCVAAAKKANLSKQELDEFTSEAFASDSYDKLLQTCIKYFECE